MDEQIKRISERNHAELFSKINLPIIARVVAISDPLRAEGLSERFRPRYAVDVQVLRTTGEPDDLLPVFRAVPLPLSVAGLERGAMGFPEPGTMVELAFAWGLPSMPFIRTILAEGLSLPTIEPGEIVIQSAPGVCQRADAAGNWIRKTDADIFDDCMQYVLECYSSSTTAQDFYSLVKHNSTEQVIGVKIIEALGALKLLSAGTLNIGAVDNLNITTASDQNNKIGRDLKQSIGNDLKQEVANIIDSIATVKQLLRVKDGGTVWLGSESENVLIILSDLIQVVSNIANTASSHTHQYTDNGSPLTTQPPIQAGTFSGQKSSADSIKSRLDPITES
jgi:hypothetical protein